MSWVFSRTSSSSSVTHRQLFANNIAAQIVATTARESTKRNNCLNISTAGCNVEVQMSAHSESPGLREYFCGSLFFLHRKLRPSEVFQRGTSDVTSDGGAAVAVALRSASCIPRTVFTGTVPQNVF